MNRSRFGIQIPFSRSVTLSMIMRLLFIATSNSHLSISIALHCVYGIAYTYVDCCTSTHTSVDAYTSTSMTFSSLAWVYIIYASTNYYSISSSSSDSSMNIKFTNVVPGLIYCLVCQHFMLLCKNSTTNVPIVSTSWIIVCANCILSIYAFPFAHFEDDDEYDDLIANG